jgi:predicted RNase H-like HicB family nuclease
MTAHYIALFELGANKNSIGVSFPQFPGCVTTGTDFDDARRSAAEALAFHVDGMREDGEKIPAPITNTLSLAALYGDVQPRDGLIPVAIPLLPSPGQTVRIQVTMDARLLSQIDAVTKNRSGFLADAAAERLSKS